MKLISSGSLLVLLFLLPAWTSGEEMTLDAATGAAPFVLCAEIEIGCIPPNRPNCPPLGQEPCLPPMYPPHPPHYPLCQECHWMWPNPLALTAQVVWARLRAAAICAVGGESVRVGGLRLRASA